MRSLKYFTCALSFALFVMQAWAAVDDPGIHGTVVVSTGLSRSTKSGDLYIATFNKGKETSKKLSIKGKCPDIYHDGTFFAFAELSKDGKYKIAFIDIDGSNIRYPKDTTFAAVTMLEWTHDDELLILCDSDKLVCTMDLKGNVRRLVHGYDIKVMHIDAYKNYFFVRGSGVNRYTMDIRPDTVLFSNPISLSGAGCNPICSPSGKYAAANVSGHLKVLIYDMETVKKIGESPSIPNQLVWFNYTNSDSFVTGAPYAGSPWEIPVINIFEKKRYFVTNLNAGQLGRPSVWLGQSGTPVSAKLRQNANTPLSVHVNSGRLHTTAAFDLLGRGIFKRNAAGNAGEAIPYAHGMFLQPHMRPTLNIRGSNTSDTPLP